MKKSNCIELTTNNIDCVLATLLTIGHVRVYKTDGYSARLGFISPRNHRFTLVQVRETGDIRQAWKMHRKDGCFYTGMGFDSLENELVYGG